MLQEQKAAVMDSDHHAELIIQPAPGSREMNLRQDRRQISLDRYRCITMYEEISLSVMIKREDMPAAKHASSLPEARGSSVRMVRDIMRHSEMLTELLSMFAAQVLLNTLCLLSAVPQFFISFCAIHVVIMPLV